MNKKELATKAAKLSLRTQKDTQKAVNAFFDVISETLVKGDCVDIPYFGRFEVKTRCGRARYTPAKSKKIAVCGDRYPVFVASRDLKLIVQYNL